MQTDPEISDLPHWKTMTESLHSSLAELVYAEALCLDEQRWQDWLALYQADAIYWIPSWKGEHRTTEDPATEVSFMYAAGRHRLEERVKRASGTKSIASIPLPRTLHCIGNVMSAPAAGCANQWLVRSNCTTQIYDLRTETLKSMACRYEHTLARQDDGGFLIARKKIVLLNDKVSTVLDFFSV